jgi:hypothetical protein
LGRDLIKISVVARSTNVEEEGSKKKINHFNNSSSSRATGSLTGRVTGIATRMESRAPRTNLKATQTQEGVTREATRVETRVEILIRKEGSIRADPRTTTDQQPIDY